MQCSSCLANEIKGLLANLLDSIQKLRVQQH